MADVDVLRVASMDDKLLQAADVGEVAVGKKQKKSPKTVKDIANASTSYALVVTERGYGKCVPVDLFHAQNRNIRGKIILKFKNKVRGGSGKKGDKDKDGERAVTATVRDALSNMRVCQGGDEVVISTSKGLVIRQRIADISKQSRTATGVLLQSIPLDDHIISVDVVPPNHVGAAGGGNMSL